MLNLRKILLAAGAVSLAGVPAALAATVQINDAVLGLSTNNEATTLEIVRPADPLNLTGTNVPDDFSGVTFIQSVAIDNTNGFRRPGGTLVGVNFGTTGGGGSIAVFPTSPSGPGTAVLTSTSATLGTTTRLSGVSVSPDNTKIAVVGVDTGRVHVLNYTGSSVSNFARSDLATRIGSTQGTIWWDNNTILTLSSTGSLLRIDVPTTPSGDLAVTTLRTGLFADANNFTSIEYVPEISPYVFVSRGLFLASQTTNTLFVLDPTNNFATLKEIDLSTSANTLRDIRLNAEGDLLIGQFNASGTGPILDILKGFASNFATVVDNSSTDYYSTSTSSSFSGLTTAIPEPASLSLLGLGGLALLRRRRA